MKSYRRIIAVIHGQSEMQDVLSALVDVASGNGQAQVLVLRVIELDRGFDPDGPAAALPEESAARRSRDVASRLDGQLARMGLGWVESRVLWRDSLDQLALTLAEWRPDLVIAHRGRAPSTLPVEADLLETASRSLLRRLGDRMFHPSPRHA